jgi:hypothetical protein
MYTWLFSLFLPLPSLVALVPPDLDADPQTLELVQTLERSGFPVQWEQPPVWGTYGLLEVKERSIWINPVVFELGIARPTIVHEAVHAVQFCAAAAQNSSSLPQSIEDLSPLGLGITPSPLVRPYILRYSNSQRRQLELEAYALQAEPDGVDRAIELLQDYCNVLPNP